MAIDAVIVNVKEDGSDLLLTLGKRIYKDGAGNWDASIPGQPVVRVINATYRPLIGQFLWGGADTARTESNVPGSQKQEYRRGASGALIEPPTSAARLTRCRRERRNRAGGAFASVRCWHL